MSQQGSGGKHWSQSLLNVGNSIGFTAPRNITFRDWRLFLIYLVLLFGALYYCYITAVNAQGYLYKEIPSGDVAIYASPGTHTAESLALFEQIKAKGGGPHAYCNNATYDYTWSATFKYENMSCAFLHSDQVSSKLGPSISFTTSFTSTKYRAKPGVNDAAQCTTACAAHAGTTAQFNGRCRCASSKDFFVVAPEAMNVNLLSYFSWSRRDGLPSQTVALTGEGTPDDPYRQLCFDPPGLDADDPSCASSVKSVSEPVPGEGRDNYLTFPVRSLLRIAGVDLDAVPSECDVDAPLPDQPGYSCRTQSLATQKLVLTNSERHPAGMRGAPSTTPRSRLTGLVVAIEAKYYNRRQAYLAFDGKVGKKPPIDTRAHHNEYLCVLKVKPYYQWYSALGHETQEADAFVVGQDETSIDGVTTATKYRYGVTFTFSSTGTVADDDPNAVLLYLSLIHI